MWSYDDWGGWYDHVAPPKVDEFGYGFRAPALLVSPYARRGYIDSTELDFTSMLKFIEGNWGLAPLAARDAQANDIRSAFDFTSGPRSPVLLDRVRDPIPPPKPKQAIVYISYSLAIAVPIGLIVIGFVRSRRRQMGRGVA
jgi:phospholipase C